MSNDKLARVSCSEELGSNFVTWEYVILKGTVKLTIADLHEMKRKKRDDGFFW